MSKNQNTDDLIHVIHRHSYKGVLIVAFVLMSIVYISRILAKKSSPNSLWRQIHQLDENIFAKTAQNHTPTLDKILPNLTHMADKSKLWYAISLGLLIVGSRFERRAAQRGILAISIASTFVNGPLKILARRARPQMSQVPKQRQCRRQPRSSSFPSGHSASAFAFATAASLENPLLAIFLFPMAFGVAISRVYTGAHYPTDVLIGSLVGIMAGLSTKKIWPLAAPAAISRMKNVHSIDHSLALSEGDDLKVVVNLNSGYPLTNQVKSIQALLPNSKIFTRKANNNLERFIERSLTDSAAVAVVGGDGTVNLAAKLAIKTKRPLLVLPGGTLNHFARDLGIHTIKDAIEAAKIGSIYKVDSGQINEDTIFVNTASIGSYVDLVQSREKIERKIGKWPAVFFALIKVLRQGKPMDIKINGKEHTVWLVFVGNGKYNPHGFAPSWRPSLIDGALDVRIVDATAPFARMKLFVSVLTGKLSESAVYKQYYTKKLIIESDQAIPFACDGEIIGKDTKLVFKKCQKNLTVYAPKNR